MAPTPDGPRFARNSVEASSWALTVEVVAALGAKFTIMSGVVEHGEPLAFRSSLASRFRYGMQCRAYSAVPHLEEARPQPD